MASLGLNPDTGLMHELITIITCTTVGPPREDSCLGRRGKEWGGWSSTDREFSGAQMQAKYHPLHLDHSSPPRPRQLSSLGGPTVQHKLSDERNMREDIARYGGTLVQGLTAD